MVLVGLLPLLLRLGFRAGLLSLDFLFSGVALGAGLILLSLTLLGDLVLAGHSADHFLDQAFGAFHDAPDRFAGNALEVGHWLPLFSGI